MLKRAGLVAVVVAALVPISLVSLRGQIASDLVVHEWGTFTSVAGADGQAVPWHPLAGSSDLPCFVGLLNPQSIKIEGNFLPSLRGRVRMETPVLYFYTPRETTVDVSVKFPRGLITEWYPTAVVTPNAPLNFSVPGGIEWSSVHVRPGARPDFPTEPGLSHYYAARATDAAPVGVNGQLEKFLFYRGLADFAPAVRAHETEDSVRIENTGTAAIPHVMLFESDGKHFGYRLSHALAHDVTLARPELTSDLASLRRDLAAMLVDQGLFPKEADAMLETWRDSWFEPGLRVLYVLPRATVDATLPLAITPAPQSIARVFVGRMEILSDAMQSEISRAVDRNDRLTLARYGRFLEPAMDQIRNRATGDERQKIDAAFTAVSKILSSSETTCQTGRAR